MINCDQCEDRVAGKYHVDELAGAILARKSQSQEELTFLKNNLLIKLVI
jgi:hypothetical protein